MEAKVRAWKLKNCYLSIFEQKSGIKKGIITYFTRDLCIVVTLGNKFQMIFLHRYGQNLCRGMVGVQKLILMSINLGKKNNSHSRKVTKIMQKIHISDIKQWD